MRKLLRLFTRIVMIITLTALTVSCAPEYANSELVIREGKVFNNGRWYPYQLLRLEGRNTPSYAVYFPRSKTETVLLTRPYTAINWTGEEVDLFQSNTASVGQILDDSMVYVINGFTVLNVFARFYTGGDIQNDIDDITAGIDFLSGKTDKIGISGGSWGGFEALYGAANASLKPAAGVAYYPPSDMESWYNWTVGTGESFFSPYRGRIDAAANGDFSRWSHEYLAENLETEFLLVHAPQDTLVPIQQSQNLAAMSERIHLFTMQRESAPLSHGELAGDYTIPIDTTISTAYLMSKLSADEILTIVDSRALEALNDEFAKEVLRDSRIKLHDSNIDRVLSDEEKEALLE